MKRDMELIRLILLLVGEYEPEEELRQALQPFSQEQFNYNCAWLIDNGYIYGNVKYTDPQHTVLSVDMFALTMQGQEFLVRVESEMQESETSQTNIE